MVSNGQGVSSPSFWDGIEHENPAGLAFNSSAKLQFGAGSYKGSGLKDRTLVSEGLLLGNGMIGAGVQYQSLPNFDGTGMTQGKIHWGLAGKIETVFTTFGISSHTTLNGGASTLDLGVLIHPIRPIRLGFMMPDFTHNIGVFAGGITFLISESLDVVIDADYNSIFSLGMLKPGVTWRWNWLQTTFAYGIRYLGESDALLSHGVSAGLGLRIVRSVLFSYEYQGDTEHRLGLTLRFN